MSGRALLTSSISRTPSRSHLALLIPLAGSFVMDWSDEEADMLNLGGPEIVLTKQITKRHIPSNASSEPSSSHAVDMVVEYTLADGDCDNEFPLERSLSYLGITSPSLLFVLETTTDLEKLRLSPNYCAQLKAVIRSRVEREVNYILRLRVDKLVVHILSSCARMKHPTFRIGNSDIPNVKLMSQIDGLSDAILPDVLSAHTPTIVDAIMRKARLDNASPSPTHGDDDCTLNPKDIEPLGAFLDPQRLRAALGLDSDCPSTLYISLDLSKVDDFLLRHKDTEIFDVPLIEAIVWRKLFPRKLLDVLRKVFAGTDGQEV